MGFLRAHFYYYISVIPFRLTFILIFLILFPIEVRPCLSDTGSSKNFSFVKSGLSEQSGVSVVDLSNGKEVFSFKPDSLLMPASTLKLVTSVAALRYLGSSFTFKTGIYLLSSDKSGSSIVIRGGGDPELTTEQVYLLARKIKLAGIKNVKRLILDSSALQDPSLIKGERAYEAGSAALSFNFNSTGVQICPFSGEGHSKPGVVPLIWEDPLKILSDIQLSKGSQANLVLSLIDSATIRVSGSIGTDSDCVVRYLSNQNPNRTFGLFFKNLLEEMGVGTKIEIDSGQIPSGTESLLEFESKPLSELLIGMNHFSTNVSAEQIVAAIGTGNLQGNLSRTRGLEKLKELLSELGYENSRIEDGSGLSRDNRLSARALSALLQFAWHYSSIRPFMESSLSILGQSGTLKYRLDESKGDYQVFAKSGTLDGVSALSGFLHLRSGKSYAFSILQNEVVDLARAHRVEEMLLHTFARQLS